MQMIRNQWPWAAAALIYPLLCLPLAMLAIYALNHAGLCAELTGFSLHRLHVLLDDGPMRHAALNLMLIAYAAGGAATWLGTLAGMAMHRRKPKPMQSLAAGTAARPKILLGVSLLLVLQALNFTLGLYSLLIAHIAFSAGFAALAVGTRLADMDGRIFDAARDLGATPGQALRLVILPLLMPGIAAGALMAFTLTLNAFAFAFLTAGSGASNLPQQILTMIEVAATLEVNAVSTLLMLLTLTVISLASRFAPEE